MDGLTVSPLLAQIQSFFAMAFSDLLGLRTLISPLPSLETRISLAYWMMASCAALSNGSYQAPRFRRRPAATIPSRSG